MANLLKKSKAAGTIEQAFAAMRLGQADRAARLLERALRQAPKNFDALTLLAGLHGQQGRFGDAAALFERAVAVRPDSAEAHYNLGVALTHLGSREQAIAAYRNALRSNPKHLEACNNLVAELLTLKCAEEALAVLRQGLLHHPGNAILVSKLGVALKDTGAIDEAILYLRQAVRLMPSNATIHANLGVALREADCFDEAVESLKRAVSMSGRDADFHNNLALALHYSGQLDAAIESAERAVALNPQRSDYRSNLGMMLLTRGDFQRGWEEYEHRYAVVNPEAERPPCDAPFWKGEGIASKRILVHAEQGLGDTLQFARYLPRLAAMQARVTFAVQPALIPLLDPLAEKITVASRKSELPSFDFQIALVSLPLRFATNLGSIPNAVPYISVDSTAIAQARERLGASPGFRVGISWQGSLAFSEDRGRSIPLREFAPLADIPGVRLIALQKGMGAKQIADVPFASRIETPVDANDLSPDAMQETAGLIMNCDLVVSSCTMIAHLAGALARPVFIALRRVPDWRWHMHREVSPWYPTARLFRQQNEGDWAGVFARISDSVRVMAGSLSSSISLCR